MEPAPRLLFTALRPWAALLCALHLSTALLLPALAGAARQPSAPAPRRVGDKPRCVKGYVPRRVKKRFKIHRGKKTVWVTRQVWRCVRRSRDRQAPTTPPGLEAAVASGSVTLVWGASRDNLRVTGYQVLRDDQPVQTDRRLFFHDTGLVNGTSYRYSVIALDAAGNRSKPASVTAVPRSHLDTEPPTVPGDLAATSGDASVSLSWSPASDNRQLAGYRVLRDGTELLQLPAAALKFDDTGLTNGTTYRYQVLAADAAGNLSAPASVSATPQGNPDAVAPSVPTGVTAVPWGTQVAISWEESSDNVAVTGYRVYRSGSADGEFTEVTTTPVTGISYTDSGLVNGNYYYRVAAADGAGNLSAQTAATGATVAPTGSDSEAPGIPADPLATAGEQQVQLGWTVASDNVAVTGYRIYRAAAAEGPWAYLASAPSNAYLNKALLYNTPYHYRLTAVDADGNESAPSTVVSGTPIDITAPAAPPWSTSTTPGLEALYEDGPNHAIRLNWQVPTDVGGSGIARYRIYRYQSNSCIFESRCVAPTSLTDYTYAKEITPGSVTTWLDCGSKAACGTPEEPHGDLPLTRKYWYYMVAYDGAGNASEPNPPVATFVSPVGG